ncbi:ABC transporter permease [Rhizobium leguminosarum]|jgi:octopine/nopaline transport system permease protein|uniref:ABC transporter permease n=1 Tax=Rhizobium leguminosarum TaxID=384 RepID=UPI003F9D6CF5
MDITFIFSTLIKLMAAVPLTLQLAALSVLFGTVIAVGLALARTSRIAVLDIPARLYIFCFRGTPLLVQIFLIYYGLGQFSGIRSSFLWPLLREPYWCAILALALNTAAYSAEIIRGGLLSVATGQIEAARACGMSRTMIFRRIAMPLAVRQALPGYGNEIINMVKATALASIITMMEITGVAAKLISETYRPLEVFIAAGAIYLAITFILTRVVMILEGRLGQRLRPSDLTTSGDAG